MVISFPQPGPSLVVFGRDHAGKPHASWFDAASAELATKAAGLMNMQAARIDSEDLRQLATSLPRGRVFASGKAFTPFIARGLYDRLVELTRGALGLTGGSDQGEVAAAVSAETGEEGASEATDKPDDGTEEADAEDATGAAVGEAAAEGEPADAPAEGEAAETGGDVPGEQDGAPAMFASPRPSRPEEVGMGSLVLAEDRSEGGWYEATVVAIGTTALTLAWRDYGEPAVVRRRDELAFLPPLSA